MSPKGGRCGRRDSTPSRTAQVWRYWSRREMVVPSSLLTVLMLVEWTDVWMP